jgi:hemerythrin-like domain-containing protein
MMDHIALFKANEDTALNDIYAHMFAYVNLLKAHIAKENNVLFRMADQVLIPAEQASLLEKFKIIENGVSPEKSKIEYANLIDQLAVFYPI